MEPQSSPGIEITILWGFLPLHYCLFALNEQNTVCSPPLQNQAKTSLQRVQPSKPEWEGILGSSKDFRSWPFGNTSKAGAVSYSSFLPSTKDSKQNTTKASKKWFCWMSEYVTESMNEGMK